MNKLQNQEIKPKRKESKPTKINEKKSYKFNNYMKESNDSMQSNASSQGNLFADKDSKIVCTRNLDSVIIS